MAKGIPDREEYGDLARLHPRQIVDWFVQKHLAERAGKHYDIRLGTKDLGLFSWASRHGLPVPGQKRLGVQQPLHEHEYGMFQGTIPEGYGKGKVFKEDQGKILITKVNPESIHFTLAHRRYPERFVLIKDKRSDKNWLMLNTTPTQPVPYRKIHYTKVDADKVEPILENLEEGSSVQAKIDGAASLTKLLKDKVEIVSYRASKVTGGPIPHTERVYHDLPRLKVPKELVGSVLRGELYGTRDGKAIPPQELGGLLNSGIAKSIDDQKSRGIALRNMIFDIQQKGNKPVTRDEEHYQGRLDEVRKILDTISGLSPQVGTKLEVPEEARTPTEALKMLRDIRGGKNPLTQEGIVIHRPHSKPIKAKFMDEHDVHIREFFPGGGKYTGKGIGGFRYSMSPDGPILGEVGTGFSDELRAQMFQDPDAYLGRRAKVRSQQVLPSGALRAPALLSLHEDYPLAKSAEYGSGYCRMRENQ